ncbi:MAG: hypothetical protein M3362_13690 [Acidobacteriota bacterium]|nr:hypothetical protein [Acidobacteriota bacterium]
MKKVLTVTLAGLLLTSAALAGTFYRNKAGSGQENNQTLTEVKVCPINGEPVRAASAPSEVVGNYKVYFCCSHHKDAFNKLSQQEKEQKIAKALEKQNQKG